MNYMHVLSCMKGAALFFTHWAHKEGFNISVMIPSVIRVSTSPPLQGNFDKKYILLNQVYSLEPQFLC